MEFCSVNMDVWYCRISVACDTMKFGMFSSHLRCCGPLRLAFPGEWRTHAPTFSTLQEKKKNKKVTLHILTDGAMRGCGLTSLVACINDKSHDIRDRNVTVRSEIWTTNVHPLGFEDITEWVILWRLILRNFVCSMATTGGGVQSGSTHPTRPKWMGQTPKTPWLASWLVEREALGAYPICFGWAALAAGAPQTG